MSASSSRIRRPAPPIHAAEELLTTRSTTVVDTEQKQKPTQPQPQPQPQTDHQDATSTLAETIIESLSVDGNQSMKICNVAIVALNAAVLRHRNAAIVAAVDLAHKAAEHDRSGFDGKSRHIIAECRRLTISSDFCLCKMPRDHLQHIQALCAEIEIDKDDAWLDQYMDGFDKVSDDHRKDMLAVKEKLFAAQEASATLDGRIRVTYGLIKTMPFLKDDASLLRVLKMYEDAQKLLVGIVADAMVVSLRI
jgi:hypothetical protein